MNIIINVTIAMIMAITIDIMSMEPYNRNIRNSLPYLHLRTIFSNCICINSMNGRSDTPNNPETFDTVRPTIISLKT